MKVKFICYHLQNTGEICDRCSTRSEDCQSHFKAKKRQPCFACSRPTKIDKPTGRVGKLVQLVQFCTVCTVCTHNN
jgi:hypothetical protein